MPSIAAWVMYIRPSTLVCSIRRQSSVSAPTIVPSSITPALLTRMSSPPSSSRVRRTAAAQACSSVTSSSSCSTARRRPGAWRRARRAGRAGGPRWRPRRPPRPARRRVASPMPDDAPVTRATFPASGCVLSLMRSSPRAVRLSTGSVPRAPAGHAPADCSPTVHRAVRSRSPALLSRGSASETSSGIPPGSGEEPMSISRTARPRRTLTGVLTATLVGGVWLVVLLPGSALANHGNGHGHGGNPHTRNVIFVNGDGMAAASARPAAWTRSASTATWRWTRCRSPGCRPPTRVTRRRRSPTRPPPPPPGPPVRRRTTARSASTSKEPTAHAGGRGEEGREVHRHRDHRAGHRRHARRLLQQHRRPRQADDIAKQYLEVTKPEVILGGGEDWWLPAGPPGASPTTRPTTPPRPAGAPRAT